MHDLPRTDGGLLLLAIAVAVFRPVQRKATPTGGMKAWTTPRGVALAWLVTDKLLRSPSACAFVVTTPPSFPPRQATTTTTTTTTTTVRSKQKVHELITTFAASTCCEHAKRRTAFYPASLGLSAHRSPAVEILDVLFPPHGDPACVPGTLPGIGDHAPTGYAQRVQAGREAQGYLTADTLATRTLMPPRELTYGEYDLGFFFDLVDECLGIRVGAGKIGDRGALEDRARDLVFADLGSGCGRLVLAQALTWPWKSCRGVEIVSSLHDMGEAALQAARQMSVKDGPATEGMDTISLEALQLLRTMAPCKLSLGDVNDEVDIADVDVLFCYSTSFPAHGDQLAELSYTLGHKLRPGAQVITTDRRLVSDGPWEFALRGEREGPNSETGGTSIAYLWEVVKSAL